MLTFTEVELSFSRRKIIDGVSFTIYPGQKVGLTGPNGAGKTTLLRLITGRLEPDRGNVAMPKGLVVAQVQQEFRLDQRPAVEQVIDGDAELRQIERAIQCAEQAKEGARLGELHARLQSIEAPSAQARAARLMNGLGFAPDDVDRPGTDFSGGWQMRLALAKALMSRSDLLLLDEPSNHLDLDAIVWLEGWLRKFSGTLVLISHDRDFMDPVIDRVLRLDNGKTRFYNGNYSAYERQHAEELARNRVMHLRQQRQVEHMQAFVNRFRAKASKARQAQSRLKALSKMAVIAPAHADSPFEFSFRAPEKLPRPLLRLEDAAVGYGDDPVVKGVDMTLFPGQRMGLLGANGTGKSTFLRLLAGELPAMRGRIEPATTLNVGYFAQDRLESLDLTATPLQSLLRLDPQGTEQAHRDFLGGFGFSGERVNYPIRPFSGGEKARLALALVLYGRPNLLLLDEPTNHLDLDMRHALGVALQSFAGAMVLVSHDRHLLRVVCDDLWHAREGTVAVFPGDLDDYLSGRFGQGAATEALAPEISPGRNHRRARRQADAAWRESLKPLKAEVGRLEAELESLEHRRQELEEELARPALYGAEQKNALSELLKERGQLAKRISDTEGRWGLAQERLDQAEATGSV